MENRKIGLVIFGIILLATLVFVGVSGRVLGNTQECTEENPCTSETVEEAPVIGPKFDIEVNASPSSDVIYLGDTLEITINVMNNEAEQVRVRVIENLAPHIMDYIDIEPQEKVMEGLITYYYRWILDIPAESSQTITYHVVPKSTGTYWFGSTMVLDPNGYDYEPFSFSVRVLCKSNGVCDPGENYMFCPEDCTTGIEDGICDAVEDGVNDPDCANEVDPDYEPLGDTDGDGVPDKDDICPGYPDIDSDSDGKPDGCDRCPFDPENDIDNDGICGDVDICPDDSGNDADSDGYCEGSAFNNPAIGGNDCDDNDSSTYPGAPEICDNKDNDCDGETDEELTPPLADNQYGICEGSVKVCDGINGWVKPDYSLLPDYEDPEVSCDYLDNDCDGEIDEGCVEIDVKFTEKTKTGSWWRGRFVINPVPGQVVVAYDKSCAETQIGSSWSEFTKHKYSNKQSEMQSIENNCELAAGCLTGENGECKLNVPEGQDYIVFSEFETWSCLAKFMNRPKFSNWRERREWLRTSCKEAGELHYAIYRYMVTAEPEASVRFAVYKTRWGAYHPIKHLGTIFGSVLDVSATEYLVRVPEGESFDSELDPNGEVRYVYPLVLESNADWEVAINTDPPEGYECVTPDEQMEISLGNPQLAVIAYKPITG